MRLRFTFASSPTDCAQRSLADCADNELRGGARVVRPAAQDMSDELHPDAVLPSLGLCKWILQLLRPVG